MKARPLISLRFSSLLLLFFFILSACTEDEDTQQGPLRMNGVTADYITNSTASLSANFTGSTAHVDEIGFCWSIHSTPTTSDNVVSFDPVAGIVSHSAGKLTGETTYYVRAYYSTNDLIYYSEAVSFTTTGFLNDLDGNQYGIVKIGNQLWMRENLRVVNYSNGDAIIDGTRKGNYSTLTDPSFYFNYNDVTENSNTYGRLYTWHVVTDDRGICPAQWRVPDLNDWEIMIRRLDDQSSSYKATQGGIQVLSPLAGGMMRSPGTRESNTGLWHAPNQGANNTSNLNVVPSGYRDASGAFDQMGYSAAFWTYTQHDTTSAMMVYSHYFNSGVHANAFSKASGYAVRCVKNAN